MRWAVEWRMVSDDLDLRPFGYLGVDVDNLAVDLAGEGVFRQAFADRRGHVGHGGVFRYLSNGPVGKLDVHELTSKMKRADFSALSG